MIYMIRNGLLTAKDHLEGLRKFWTILEDILTELQYLITESKEKIMAK